MQQQNFTLWVSLASLGISLVLAIVKLVEFFGTNKVRLKTEVMLTGSSELGHTITILNDSAIPVTVGYFEIVWTEKRKLFGLPIPFTRKVVDTDSPIEPPDGYNALIEAHKAHELNFMHDYQFDWGEGLTRGVWLRVWIVGHDKPFMLYITGPK
jgi:hypothetical protein